MGESEESNGDVAVRDIGQYEWKRREEDIFVLHYFASQ